MNNITYAVSVDVNNPIIPYNVYVASVLDSNVRYLEVTLYENGNVITLSNTATATASFVTDNVLVDDSVECTISNNIITVPLEDLQRRGNLDVQVTVTEGAKVLAIPFPIQVRVTPNIAENAQIDNDSLGSYAEVVREIAAARGDYPDLKGRLDGEIDRIDDDISDINTALLGKANKAAAGIAGELAALDGNGSPIRSGVSVIQSIGEGSNSRVPTTAAVKNALDGKADKAAAGIAGELAALDGNGSPIRSGVSVIQSIGEGSNSRVPTTEAVKTALAAKVNTADLPDFNEMEYASRKVHWISSVNNAQPADYANYPSVNAVKALLGDGYFTRTESNPTVTAGFTGSGVPIFVSGNTMFSAGACTGNIVTLFVPRTVTKIDGGAFSNCASLTDVYIDNEAKSDDNPNGIEITSSAFGNSVTVHYNAKFNAVTQLIMAIHAGVS